MKKILSLLVACASLAAAPGPQFLNVQFAPTNNNLVMPTNINFVGAGISNASLVTNLTEFILWARANGGGTSTNAQVVSGTSLGLALNNTSDDTVAWATAISTANLLGQTIDLQGRTSLVTQVSITVPIKIQNGTIKQFSAAQTNLNGMLNITSPNVSFSRVNIDGNNTTLRGIRLNPSSYYFDFEGGSGVNFLQPTNYNAQTAFFMADWSTSFRFRDGWFVSNVVAVANGIIGDDPGTSRGFVIVRSTGTVAPIGLIEDGGIYDIKSTGSSPKEDSDAISIHRYTDGELVPITIQNIFFKNVTKRGVKAMSDGYAIDRLTFDLSDLTDTNYPMLSAVSAYAGKGFVSRVNMPAGLFSYGVEAVNNNSVPLSDIVIANNNIGVGTSALTNPVAIGIKLGGLEGWHNARITGNSISNMHMGIQIAGNVTNYAVVDNIIANPLEEGVMDGYRYSGDLVYTNNWNGFYAGNLITGTPSGGGIRLRRTKNVTLGQNYMPASYSYTFDNGYSATMASGSGIYSNNIYGGTLTNINAIHIGDSATTTWLGEVPDIQGMSSLGTNFVGVFRYYDPLSLNRLFAYTIDTNGVHLHTSQSSGGNGVFDISMGLAPKFSIDASGVLRAGTATAGNRIINTATAITDGYLPVVTNGITIAAAPIQALGTNMYALGQHYSFGYETYGGIKIGTVPGAANDISVPAGGSFTGAAYVSGGNILVGTNLSLPSGMLITNFPTGRGITNTAGVVKDNLVAGSNITLTEGANGALTIASTGGGSGIAGTVFNTTYPTALGQLAVWQDTTKTNLGGGTNYTIFNDAIWGQTLNVPILQSSFIFATNYGTIYLYGNIHAYPTSGSVNTSVSSITSGRQREIVTAYTSAAIALPLTASYSGHVFDNFGASAMQHLILGTAASEPGTNVWYTFNVTDADGITIYATNSSTIIRGTTVSAANGSISATSIGSSITLYKSTPTNWIAIAMTGDFSIPSRRVETLTDAATVTPSVDSYQVGILTTLSQATQIANPTGTPVNGQLYQIRIKSTTTRALTYGSQFRGSTDLPLPSSTSGSSLTDYMGFQWNSADTKWDIVARNFGF